jgi:Ca2+-binding EF-hand superfamily protein
LCPCLCLSAGEFRRAIHALGFGALADTEDIDMVFDEFDESKDGELEFKEINKMLRQSAAVDARMVGGAKGRVALKAEREAKLKRTKNERKGVNRLVALNPAKIVRGRELLAELKSLFSAMPADKLMDLFREIDQSGDGIIDQAEFNLAIRALGFSLPKDELKLLFRQLDPDSSGTIEYHELRQALCGK